jgi:ribose/xylose/arabinose/galactoside ABC-type transport system permease subunit
MIAIAAKTALSVQTMFAMSVSVMSQTASEIRAWEQFRRTPGMQQLWTHCDMFAAFGVGLAVGVLMGLTFAVIVIK